jgi:cation diffusion facilitator CzcD-associated flavoprotein CzcO
VTRESDIEHFDVIVVGAGLSGIGAAHHLRHSLPNKTFAVIEGRDAIGGTWDLFRYPGVRSDSDMFTLGYAFRPWLGENAIADGAAILDYIRETAMADELDRAIRFGHRLVHAAWSSPDAVWTLDVASDAGPRRFTCGFLFMCAGYYDYASGYTPDFPGIDRFGGKLVHPQAWPDDLAYAGKRVVVIGSGATAVTLVPALAEGGARVTMLQRSPSYVVSLPAKDRFAARMRRVLPPRLAYRLVRWRNIVLSRYLYGYARRKPEATRRRILSMAQRKLGAGVDAQRHFNPTYNPWDQRICLCPDGDFFNALKRGTAEIATDEIETFTETGLQLRSGRALDADIVVTATGLNLKLMGGVTISVDGRDLDLAKTTSYKGSMLSDVPNLAYALGYTNASWTLKCDLTSAWVCRVLAYMDRRGFVACVPRADPSVETRPLIDFSSGYVRRSIAGFPRQGDRKPWRLNQDYLHDTLELKLGPVDDGTLVFSVRDSPSATALDPASKTDLPGQVQA